MKHLNRTTLTLVLGTLLSVPNIATAEIQPDQQLKPEQIASTETHAPNIQPNQLAYHAQDVRLPVEERAAALKALSHYPSQNALVAVARGLQDSDPIIRQAAAVGAEPYGIEHRWRMVSPLLSDSDAMVRITAATNLVRDYGNVSQEQKEQLEAPVAELKAHLKEKQDSDSKLLLADVYRWHKEWGKADTLYQDVLTNEPNNDVAWLSLADNYRAQNMDAKAIETLDEAIEQIPNSAELHYSKSLALVRLEKHKVAANEIETAANMAQNNSYYWYLNGVLQESLDIDKSTQSFEKAYLISGAPEQLYAVCDIYVRYDHPKSQQCLEELGKIAPSYVIEQLEAKQKS
ncbi:tetratricopeptide repeat protein [Vibrio sp. RE86]|uniref:tetratricopeptide repeat protein n=1 Tax=Vibrio sp. RE86 TaxID=2607605 RepID=UPI00149344A0|nr:tetratricopeptide repeat protein [Vibrio sp. RE86]NOH81043.1 tetratricopeptide repeat protein [Vibrio sp. RE86]